MKSLVDVMRDLEREGFMIAGGEWRADGRRIWTFARSEGKRSLSIIRVTHLQVDEEEEPELEPEEREEQEVPIGDYVEEWLLKRRGNV